MNNIKAPNEKKGEGVNKVDYWVTTNLLDVTAWSQLPLITRFQMQESKKIKYLFKGVLDQEVISSPIFSGQEKHLVICY